MKRTLACCTAMICAALAVPAFAGTVYVPVAPTTELGDFQYETRLWVSNRGTEERRFSSLFLPVDTDGVDRDGNGDLTTVPGGTTILVTNAGDGDSGMLEISGAPQFAVNPFLVRKTADGAEMLASTLPVISSDNVIPANETTHLQGWERNDTRLTDFVLVNLAHEPSQCLVDVLAADGEPIVPTGLVSMDPLSQRQFTDVLGFIGLLQVHGARVAVSCDQDFFAFALLLDRESGEALYVGPSGSLTSTLLPPGEAPPPPPACPAGAFCFEEPGVFHTPTSNNRVERLAFPVDPGQYSTIRLRLEVYHGGWAPNNTSGTHNIFWLALDRNRNLYGYVNVKGPNANQIFIRHGIGQPQGQKPRIDAGLALAPNRTYTFDYLYDTDQGVVELVVTDANGKELKVLRGAPDVNTIRVPQGETFFMDFGFTGANPNEPPTYGWRYQNLTIDFIP